MNNNSTYNFSVETTQIPVSPIRSSRKTEERKRKQHKSVNFSKSVLIQQAITDGDLQQLIQLIHEHGKSIVNCIEPSGLSPAMRCVFESQMAALRIVVAAGANLSHCDSEKWTALHVAASMDDIPAAIFILKWCREDLTQFVSIDGERPIDLAQSPEMIQLLQFCWIHEK